MIRKKLCNFVSGIKKEYKTKIIIYYVEANYQC